MINAIVSSLKLKVSHSLLKEDERRRISTMLDDVPHQTMLELYGSASEKLSATTMMYLCCFIAGLDSESIATIFGIEVSSVYRSRSRIRKMFPKDKFLPF